MIASRGSGCTKGFVLLECGEDQVSSGTAVWRGQWAEGIGAGGASLVMLNVMGDLRSPWLEFTVSYIPLYGLLLLGAFFVNELRDVRNG